jgi:hypothetical protein
MIERREGDRINSAFHVAVLPFKIFRKSSTGIANIVQATVTHHLVM